MIYSMTAYAQNITNSSYGRVCWELRSVNHRYLELYFKLPEEIRDLEYSLREIGRQELARGKLDCLLKLENAQIQTSHLEINERLVSNIAVACGRITQLVPNCAPVSPLQILHWPGVIINLEQENEGLYQLIKQEFKQTITALKQARNNEGEALLKVINTKLDAMSQQIKTLQQKFPEILAQQKQRLLTKLTELQLNLDENRLEEEFVYLLQKADIIEEIERLSIHVDEFKNVCASGGVVGKKLDFIVQEMNREANTIASKSCSNITSSIAVELKVLIEQIREQAQNIE